MATRPLMPGAGGMEVNNPGGCDRAKPPCTAGRCGDLKGAQSHCCSRDGSDSQVPPEGLFPLNGFEERLEIPFPEAPASFALDDLIK